MSKHSQREGVMNGSFNYVMVKFKDGTKVRVTRKQWEAYQTAKRMKQKLPKLTWEL